MKKKTNNIIKFKSKKQIRRGNIKKAVIAIAFLTLNILGVINTVQAQTISNAHVYSIGDCGNLLTYKGMIVKTDYVIYTENGVQYPAYCMDKTKKGANTGGYTVSIQNAIQDVGLWRRIINGYPYKTIEELGVANKEEAFTATKQAIYCYLHENQLSDYGAIGEAGSRTLNAMAQIIQNAENSTETKISSTITIDKVSEEWKQDEINKNYAYKTYQVTAGAEIENYKITIQKENAEDIGGIKITDEQNQERNEFAPNEKFKVLIPIKNMTENGTIKLSVESKIKTKPVLYGAAPDSSSQDYALTAAMYEDGSGNIKDTYTKNETKIIITKKDEESGELLEGVEFELLDENKQTVYTSLKTNKDGKIVIENLVPGTYYVKETKTIDGYELYELPIKVELGFNQEVSVTVNNNKKDEPTVETITKTSKEVKRLPVTGK